MFLKKINLKSFKTKVIIFLIVLQILSLILIVRLYNSSDIGKSYPMGREHLEYAFIGDRYDVKILDSEGNDITTEFLEENKKYYIADDWDKIMDNFVKESGNLMTDDKYDKSISR